MRGARSTRPSTPLAISIRSRGGRMNAARFQLRASISKKVGMALTGLFMCFFLVPHLIGNALMVGGAELFNSYAHFLITNPLVVPAEIVIAVLFLGHILSGYLVTWENRKARPEPYVYRRPDRRKATIASRSMPYTGTILLIFLVFHIMQFKYGPHYAITHDGVEMRDMYRMVIDYFQAPLNVAWYVVAMILLGFHVSHGGWSAFQSLGLNHPRVMPMLQRLSILFGLFMALAYAALAIWCHFQGVTP